MKRGWLNRNIIGFCSASFFADWCQEMTNVVLPLFIAQIIGSFHAPFVLGLIQGGSQAVSTLAKLISGWLAHRVSYYKPFLIIGYGSSGIFIALIGTTHSIMMIFFYKVIAWFGKGLREPMRDTWLAQITSPRRYGLIFGLHRALDSLGALIGPLCTFILLRLNYSLSLIFFIAIIPGVFSMLSIIWLTREEKQLGDEKKVFLIDQVKQLPQSFVYFVIILFVFSLGYFNHILLIHRVQNILGKSNSSIIATSATVLLYAFFNIIRALSEVSIGTLSDYINRKILLATSGFGLFGITCLGCMMASDSLFLWYTIFGLAGISIGTIKALAKSYAAYILPDNIRGVGLGLFQSIEGIGDLLSSAIVGFIWAYFSPSFGFGYAATLSFIAMLLLIMKK